LSLNAELARSRPGWLKWLAAGNAMLLLVRLVLFMLYAQLYERDLETMLPTSLIAATLYVAGVFALTRAEHPYLLTPAQSRVRRQRWLAVAMLLCVATAMLHQRYAGRGGSGILGIFQDAGYFHPLALELALGAWLIFALLIVMEYQLLARLASRLLDRFMTEHCRIAGAGAAVGGIVMLCVVRTLAVHGLPSSIAGMWAVAAVIIPWQLFVIWAAFMNGYCAMRFLQQAWIAERNWQRGNAELEMSNAD
jgi:succinate dehydrogenase hydrophobic anchor subunit